MASDRFELRLRRCCFELRRWVKLRRLSVGGERDVDLWRSINKSLLTLIELIVWGKLLLEGFPKDSSDQTSGSGLGFTWQG